MRLLADRTGLTKELSKATAPRSFIGFASTQLRINTAWVQLAASSADLIAWLRLLALTPELAKAEPKALRYRLLHVPAKLTTGGRRRRLRIPSNWPWAKAIVSAFANIAAIPAPR